MEELLHPRILVVDDEEVVRSLCARVLTPLGYGVETAADGSQALAWFEKQTFDLVITDYRMPGELNGLELGHTIKGRYPDTLIILMTAFPAVDNAVEMLRMGASDYLIKPFEQAELVRCVKSCFAKPAPA
jgi:DNA-binding NtrC family response regulator